MLYQQAAAAYGVDWAVLAAIGKLECDHGRSQARGCNPPGSVNSAGATGPMQFLGPTWRSGTPLGTVPAIGPPTVSTSNGYATDGDGDGLADVWDPADAIFAAARLLRANGAPGNYPQAILAYNHSTSYVDEVLAQADEYRAALAPGASGAAAAVLSWAVSHVGTFTYHLGPPTDRGGTVAQMQTSQPAGTTCDCSMFVRWAMAQAGLDVGLTTSTQWTANGRLPAGNTPQDTPLLERGVGPDPPAGGYRPGRSDLLRRRRRPQRPRRALARQRPTRPMLRQQQRLQHPAARRLRHPDRLAPLETPLRLIDEFRRQRSMPRPRTRSSSTSLRSCMSWGRRSGSSSADSMRARSPIEATDGLTPRPSGSRLAARRMSS